MESFWDHFGVILGSFWDHFGIVLGSFWNHFGIVLGSCLKGWQRVPIISDKTNPADPMGLTAVPKMEDIFSKDPLGVDYGLATPLTFKEQSLWRFLAPPERANGGPMSY